MNTSNIWLLVGRETEGNSIKNYIFMNYNGCTKFITKRSAAKFCKEHDVINVQVSGSNIIGKGITINAMPRYVKQQGFGLQQVSGVSQAEVIQMAQPLINQYIQKKEAAQQRKEANSPEAQKAKQNEYVINKLIVIENLIATALAMKDITNELASSEHITRYIKQIDIDNAEGDSLDNLIKRQGVNGLVNGLLLRLDKLNIRITKYNLDKALRGKISELKNKCNDIRNLHEKTRKIIKDNKEQDRKQLLLLKEPDTELYDTPVVDEVSSDMIAVDLTESSDNCNDLPVVESLEDAIPVEVDEFYGVMDIEALFLSNENDLHDDKKVLSDNISKTAANIKDDAEFKSDTLYNIVKSLEKIDVNYYLSKLNGLKDDNLAVLLYKPVIEYIRYYLKDMINQYKAELDAVDDVIDFATEVETKTSASNADILAALNLFDDI